MTDTPETYTLGVKDIQHRHNETLTRIVAAWKSNISNPKDNTVDIKVSFFLNSLIWINRSQSNNGTPPNGFSVIRMGSRGFNPSLLFDQLRC
jgi:hypothetical protein